MEEKGKVTQESWAPSVSYGQPSNYEVKLGANGTTLILFYLSLGCIFF